MEYSKTYYYSTNKTTKLRVEYGFSHMEEYVEGIKTIDTLLSHQRQTKHEDVERLYEYDEGYVVCSDNWEAYYGNYLEYQKEVDLHMYDLHSSSIQELHLQTEIVKHNRWKKKRKHVKDTKRTFREVKLKRCWIDYRRGSYYKHVTHKHLRAEKHYLEEELDDADSSFWFDEDFEGSVEWWDYEDNWEDYVDPSGRALNPLQRDRRIIGIGVREQQPVNQTKTKVPYVKQKFTESWRAVKAFEEGVVFFSYVGGDTYIPLPNSTTPEIICGEIDNLYKQVITLKEWFDNIPVGGVLCWVSDQIEKPSIINGAILGVIVEYKDDLLLSDTKLCWEFATPLTKEEITTLLNNSTN